MPVGIHLFGTETRITVRSLTANDRSALIRLAHTRPDLRSVLLPFLKNAASAPKFPRIVKEVDEDYRRKAITVGEKNELLAAIEDAETEQQAQKIVADHRKGRVAAVSGKAQKPELDFADAYYEMAGGITAVKMAAKDSKDPELVKLAAKVDQAGNALHAYLERTYLWD